MSETTVGSVRKLRKLSKFFEKSSLKKFFDGSSFKNFHKILGSLGSFEKAFEHFLTTTENFRKIIRNLRKLSRTDVFRKPFYIFKKLDNSYELWVCRDKNTFFFIQSGPNKVDKEKEDVLC